MTRKKTTKVLSAILATAVFMGNLGTVSAANIQPQNSKDTGTYSEIEPNNESTQATGIAVNQQCYGVLADKYDVDWYKVTTTENGYIRLKFDIDYAKYYNYVHGGWEFEVYNEQFHKIDSYSKKDSFIGDILPYKKGTFYIKVTTPSYYAASGVPYGITVCQVESDAWEKEENNTQQTANNIKINKQYSGLIAGKDDVDWYQFNLTKDSTVKFNFGRIKNLTIEQVQAIKSGWDMYIYRASDSKEVGWTKHVTEKVDDFAINLKKGKYYIKVCPNATYWCVGWIPYNLKLSTAVTPAKTKIQKADGDIKSATIRWKKVAGASGYFVYRSTSKNGTYKKVATIKRSSKTSFTNKKLKSKKTYYYKVAAYKKANGVTAVAKQSSVKSVKTK